MHEFLELEGAYLVIGVFALAITLFVSTRSFMPKGGYKKGMSIVTLVLALLIGADYMVRINRMNGVKTAFKNGKTILCESRMLRKAAQSVVIEKSNNWSLKGDIFSSPEYSRTFHSARCMVKPPIVKLNK